VVGQELAASIFLKPAEVFQTNATPSITQAPDTRSLSQKALEARREGKTRIAIGQATEDYAEPQREPATFGQRSHGI